MSGRHWSAAEIADAIGEHRPTEEQARVIEAPVGPALVVAGAGSGKTTTMAMRVLYLVANGIASPDEVLGLTFTRKAARELRDRIASLLDRFEQAEQAERGGSAGERQEPQLEAEAEAFDLSVATPTVTTYNAFAASIYREHALVVGLDPEAELASEAAAWQLARRTVVASRLPGLAALDKRVDDVTDAVLALSHALGDNAVSDPAAVGEYVARFLAHIRALPLGDRHERRGVVEECERVDGLRTLLPLVAEFREAKRRRGLMEFSDQVVSALSIVRASEAARESIRARHRFVLLDEYQDTSVVQTELLSTLFAARERDEQRVIVAVGDPNQSIYGWRGASDANLSGFPGDFGGPAGVEHHELLTSWRNPERVLSAANLVAKPLREKANVGMLLPRPGATAGRFDIEWAETLDDEAELTARWFAERLRGSRPTELPTAAILFRKRKHIPRFAAVLEAAGIEHRVLGVGGLLTSPEVTDLLAGLRVLVDPDGGSALIRLLVGGRWRIGVRDLAALREFSRVIHRQRAGEHAASVDDAASIVDGLDALLDTRDDWDALAGFTSAGLERLRDAAQVFRALRLRLGSPITEIVRLVEEALRLDIEIVANERRAAGAAQLRAFRAQVEAFTRIDESGTIGGFLSWADRAIAADERIGPAEEPAEPGVVQLLTVHAAKGLQWDAVAIPRLVEDDFPDAPREGKGWVRFGELPYEFRGDREALRGSAWFGWESTADRKELAKELEAFAAQLRTRHLEEERRLAYVAITRTKRDLLLTGSFWPGKSVGPGKSRRPRLPSTYIADDLVELEPRVADFASAHDADPSDAHRDDVQWPFDPLGTRRPRVEQAAALVRQAIETGDRELGAWRRDIELLLAEHRASLRASSVVQILPPRLAASGFRDWMQEPLVVAARAARPMPEAPHRASRIGTLFHAWVESRYRSVMPTPLIDLDELISDEDRPERDRGLVPDSSDMAKLEALKDRFERSEWAGRAPLAVEETIDLPFAGHTIPCRIDAVFQRGDRIEIIDWKTGTRTTGDLSAYDYQLALYRIAWSHRYGVPIEQIEAKAYFVDADLVYEPSTLPDRDELLARWEAAFAERSAG